MKLESSCILFFPPRRHFPPQTGRAIPIKLSIALARAPEMRHALNGSGELFLPRCLGQRSYHRVSPKHREPPRLFTRDRRRVARRRTSRFPRGLHAKVRERGVFAAAINRRGKWPGVAREIRTQRFAPRKARTRIMDLRITSVRGEVTGGERRRKCVVFPFSPTSSRIGETISRTFAK